MLPIIDVKELVVSFGETDVVKSVSFDIMPGETLGIVGESGSGKSVTSLSLMRLLDNSGSIRSGIISYRNKKNEQLIINRLSENQMRALRGADMAMIFQEPMTSLNPVLRCGQQVMEAIRVHNKISRKEARERTLALFEKVRLPRARQIIDAWPHQLSGGQKQRVMIAMAISCNPRLLIADEPTTALDVTVQKEILELLLGLQEEYGMSMIFITHDLGVTTDIAHRVLVMHQGEVVESGKTNDLFSHPSHPYTKGLIACRPPVNNRLRRLPVVSDFLSGNCNILEQEENTISKHQREEHHKQLYAGDPLMRVEGLSKIYEQSGGWRKHKITAVDQVSFEVYAGETLGLVGESGCGKTTLGRCLLRLIEPSQGRIWFDGQEITAMNPSTLRTIRKSMQIVFQDPYSSLNPRMSIGDAISEPMRVHGLYRNRSACKKRMEDLLTQVGLPISSAGRLPHEFSGGQRQRIVIARALAVNPRFLICDESVSALDVSVQAQILNLLNDLKKENGLTYIFISHDLSVVKYMSDRMLVMNQGRIEESGDPDQIFAFPTSPYTSKLIDAIPGKANSYK